MGTFYSYSLISNMLGFLSFLFDKVFKKPTTTLINDYDDNVLWLWFFILSIVRLLLIVVMLSLLLFELFAAMDDILLIKKDWNEDYE